MILRAKACAFLTAVAAAALTSGCGDQQQTHTADVTPRVRKAVAAQRPRTVVRKQVLTFVDERRRVRRLDGHVVARRLVTVVRYPVTTAGGRRVQGPRRLPLVVFAHGYALTPRRYRTLLHHWARAGYVVAAPVFPGERAGAPGGPNRADLINEPADLRYVISRLLAASARSAGAFAGLIDRSRIALAGHSDGGNAVLSLAYDKRFRSRRIEAAIVLAGADMPGIAPFRFPADGPPLLAVQGGADLVNPPTDTQAYFRRAHRPKLLLSFPGAGHYGPYMIQRPQLTVLERVTTAFLGRTLKSQRISTRELKRLGRRRGVSRLRVVVRG